MVNKENYIELLKTQELSAYEFREKVGELLKAHQNNELDHLVFDIETRGLDILSPTCNLIGFSFADPINKIGYFVGHTHPEFLISEHDKALIISCLFKLLYNIPVVGHNLKFDLSYLVARFKLDMKKVVVLDDTLFMAYYYYGAKRDTGISLSLKSIFRHLFGVELVWEEELTAALMAHKRIADRHFNNVAYKTISTYGAYDSIATYYLRLGLKEKLKTRILTAYEFLIKSIHAFVELETTGISLDWEFRDFLLKNYREKIEIFENQFQDTPIIQSWKEDHFQEFNLNSIKMIGEILYGKNYYNCPVLSKTLKGAPSTNEEALLELLKENKGKVPAEAKEFIKELLGNRNSVKMVTTYLEPLTERVNGDKYCPDYNLVGTATGRISSYFHTLPSGNDVKRMINSQFKNEGGVVIASDFCLAGETKISLLNGTEVPIKDLEKDSEFYVYSCKTDGEVVLTKAKSLGITRYVDEMIEVELDNGETIRTTVDHKFLKRDGTYCEAQYLKEGESLMPLYRKYELNENTFNRNGYEQYYNNKNSSWEVTHRRSAATFNFTEKNNKEIDIRINKSKGKFCVVHHIDFNKLNNSPENLQWLGDQEHLRYHQALLSDLWKDPEFRKKTIASIKLASKKNWGNPKFVSKMKSIVSKQWENYSKEDYEAHCNSISKTLLDNGTFKGKNNPMFGKTHLIREKWVLNYSNFLIGNGLEVNQENWEQYCYEFGPKNTPKFEKVLSELGKLGIVHNPKLRKKLSLLESQCLYTPIKLLESDKSVTKENWDAYREEYKIGKSKYSNLRTIERALEVFGSLEKIIEVSREQIVKNKKTKISEEYSKDFKETSKLMSDAKLKSQVIKFSEFLKTKNLEINELNWDSNRINFGGNSFPTFKKSVNRLLEFGIEFNDVLRVKLTPKQEWGLGVAKTIIKQGKPICKETWEEQRELWKTSNPNLVLFVSLDFMIKCFGSIQQIKEQIRKDLEYYNHKITKVTRIKFEEQVPTYCLSILSEGAPTNFAVTAGVFVSNSQLEVRVIAGLAADPGLKEAYVKGYDIHAYVASQVFKVPISEVSKENRKFAKTVVFGILYGKQAYSLSEELGISKEEAQKLVDFFFVGFPLVKNWIDKQHRFLKQHKCVTTPFGRFRYLPDIDNPEFKKQAEAKRAAQNSPIQSTASDLAFSAALRIYYELRDNNYKSKFIGTVHDSIIVDAHPDEIQKVLSAMHYHMNTYINTQYDFLNGLPISSDFEVGTSWGGSCGISKFTDNVWVLSGHQLDADNLVERLKIRYPNIKVSEFQEQAETEDKIIKFVNPGRKVKFKIVWS